MHNHKIIDFLLNHTRAITLGGGIAVIIVLFLIVDLPLVQNFFQKVHRTYQMNKKYNTSEILEKEIQREKNLNAEIIKVVSHLQFKGIAQNRLTPIIELFNQSAKNNKVSLVSVNSSSKIEEEEYVRIPFEIKLEGKYHRIAKFISNIENSSYPLRVESLDISTRDYISYNTNAHLEVNLYLIRE